MCIRDSARGAHADVVGDEDADARTGEGPVVEALEVDPTSRREGICLVFQGPVARGCALVALADGAAAAVRRMEPGAPAVTVKVS